MLKKHSKSSFDNYNTLLNLDEFGETIETDKTGIARELARMSLPLNTYTQWYWKIDLHNLMHFLALRFDPHAQYEIRVYAEIMMDVLKKWVPLTYEAFINNRMDALTLSSEGIKYIKSKLHKKRVDTSKISKRELENLKKIFET